MKRESKKRKVVVYDDDDDDPAADADDEAEQEQKAEDSFEIASLHEDSDEQDVRETLVLIFSNFSCHVSMLDVSFPCARLPGPVHTVWFGRVCFLCAYLA